VAGSYQSATTHVLMSTAAWQLPARLLYQQADQQFSPLHLGNRISPPEPDMHCERFVMLTSSFPLLGLLKPQRFFSLHVFPYSFLRLSEARREKALAFSGWKDTKTRTCSLSATCQVVTGQEFCLRAVLSMSKPFSFSLVPAA